MSDFNYIDGYYEGELSLYKKETGYKKEIYFLQILKYSNYSIIGYLGKDKNSFTDIILGTFVPEVGLSIGTINMTNTEVEPILIDVTTIKDNLSKYEYPEEDLESFCGNYANISPQYQSLGYAKLSLNEDYPSDEEIDIIVNDYNTKFKNISNTNNKSKSIIKYFEDTEYNSERIYENKDFNDFQEFSFLLFDE
ncbi:MAG: hypothetical protein IJX17_04240 [Clostridia bacterium]|nr:hypothetical protein [Clostridia bacterium]